MMTPTRGVEPGTGRTLAQPPHSLSAGADPTDRAPRDRAPGDARRDGRGLVPPARRRGVRGGRVRLPRRRRPWAPTRWSTRSGQVKAATDKPFGVDLLTALPDQMLDQGAARHRGRVPVFVAGLGVPRDVIELCHDNNVLVVNMCGKVRHAIAAVEAGCDIVVAQGTEAGGHTGHGRDHGTRPPGRRRGRRPRARGRRRRHLRRPRPRRRARARRRRRVDRDAASSRRPRRAPSPATRTRCSRIHEDGTVVSRAYTGKTMRVVRNDVTQYFEEHPDELKPFPEQMRVSFGGRLHAPRRSATPLPASTPNASATRQGRASAPSTSSFPPPSS